jgi:hypothetical protein
MALVPTVPQTPEQPEQEPGSSHLAVPGAVFCAIEGVPKRGL